MYFGKAEKRSMNKNMTICECLEYLESMIGDNQEIQECIDYIEDRAKSMTRQLKRRKKQVRKLKRQHKNDKLYIKELRERYVD